MQSVHFNAHRARNCLTPLAGIPHAACHMQHGQDIAANEAIAAKQARQQL